jgi:hypothetical protein
VRGGLDDALDKLARRDELRRRTAGEAMGTPPAVQDLVEAIAAVVGRNPALAVTVGVEGAGDPVLLHFALENGIVQVSADNTVASRVAEAAPTSPRHADFDIDPDEPDPYPATSAHGSPSETGQATRGVNYDQPGAAYGTGPYRPSPPFADDGYAAEPVASHRRPDPPHGGYARPRDSAFPTGAGTASRFGATPDPFVEASRASSGEFGATSGPFARASEASYPEPIPLKVDTTETEQAAKRLAALLRDNPTLLRRSSPD